MVLPEIEEEDEDLNQRHSKLSLTSLLLGKIFKKCTQFVAICLLYVLELSRIEGQKVAYTLLYLFYTYVYFSILQQHQSGIIWLLDWKLQIWVSNLWGDFKDNLFLVQRMEPASASTSFEITAVFACRLAGKSAGISKLVDD